MPEEKIEISELLVTLSTYLKEIDTFESEVVCKLRRHDPEQFVVISSTDETKTLRPKYYRSNIIGQVETFRVKGLVLLSKDELTNFKKEYSAFKRLVRRSHMKVPPLVLDEIKIVHVSVYLSNLRSYFELLTAQLNRLRYSAN